MEEEKNKIPNMEFNNEKENLKELQKNGFLRSLQFKILALFGFFLIILIAGAGIYFNISEFAKNKASQENLIAKQEISEFQNKNQRNPKSRDNGMAGIERAIWRGEWKSLGITTWKEIIEKTIQL